MKMQAVILCAGKSTRTHPLTVNVPKTLLKVANKAIIEHNLEQLKGIADEAILVVGFKKEEIKKRLGNSYNGIRLIYVEQKEQLGTWHAVLQAKDKLKERFIVMGGDDLFSREDIKKCAKKDNCVLLSKSNNPSSFGVFEIKGKKITGIEEKPEKPKSDLVNTGLYVFSKEVFKTDVIKSQRGEYEIVDCIKELIKKGKLEYEIVGGYWVPIGYPWDLINANEFLLARLSKMDIKGEVEKNAVIKGNVVIGKGTVVKSGVYIEGPAVIGENCKIGPNCYIRPYTAIGNNCKVGNACEIKNSVFFDSVSCGHLSYIGDSVIGSNVNLGAGTITANLRHDYGTVKSMVKWELVDTGRKKLGTIIAENVHTGIHTSIYPGRKLWPNTSTKPGEVVEKDLVK